MYLVNYNLVSTDKLLPPPTLPSSILLFTGMCYSLDMKCPPKKHVLKT
jgi:hypothetical protein